MRDGDEQVFAAEAGIAGVRVAIVALNSAVYLFLMDKAGTIPLLAMLTIVAANAYSLGVFFLKPYRRFPVLLSSYFTTGLDAAFITVWLVATGGLASPFYPLWLVSVAAVAFRYDAKATVSAAALYSACYLALGVAMGQAASHVTDLVVRCAYIFFTAAIGALLTREASSQRRQKIEMRELADALRESEERFRRLSDATAEGVAIHENGVVREANGVFARMFGYEIAEVVGREARDFVALTDQAAVAEQIAHPVDAPYEIVGRRKDGTTFDLEVTSRAFPYDGRPARVVAVRDITERKRADRAIRDRAALEAANERLREMDGLKTKFINSAAHELGTPLTPIKLQAHLLKLGNLGELNEKQRRAIDVLSRNVDHLGLMVKDLLDAARIESRELKLHPADVDAYRLLADCLESFSAGGASAVHFHLSCPTDLRVRGDPARLTQVVLNLVGNALKFTPAGGDIRIRASSDGTFAHVEVTDSGAGIEPADLARLFIPFSQVHDTSRSSRAGAGLGLYISKGIIESHGGRIWARSDGRGHGTTVGFSVPLAGTAVVSAQHAQR